MSDDPNERFREATDRLIAEPPSFQLRRLADKLRVSLNSVNRARMRDGQKRSPPSGWERVVARMANDHAEELAEKARDLKALAAELESTSPSSLS